LTALSANSSFPSPTAPSGDSYCPYGAAADGSNHVIIAVGQMPSGNPGSSGPWQLAIYTPGTNGALTTTSSYQTMTTLNIGDFVKWYAFSPDNKYLAVAGAAGLQVLTYNSANQTFTAIGPPQDTGNSFQTLSWDMNDHLYALAVQSNSLYVYTVTSTAITPVAGSPYSIQNPVSVVTLSPSSGSGS
ncbi:MAG: hypothetical protein WB974_09830, partial [Acidobacteriaceae bacterium]